MNGFFRDLYENFEKYFSAFLMVLMVVCLMLQVVYRYVFGAGITWSEELSRIAFVWVIYLGMSLAAKDRHHIRVTAQFLAVPMRLRPYWWLGADILWIAINVVIVIQGIVLLQHSIEFPATTPALGWPVSVLEAIVPFGFALMTFRIIQGYVRGFRDGTWKNVVKLEE